MTSAPKEKLTEMITVVIPPSMKEKLLAAASDSTVPYGVIVRWALQDWFTANSYNTPAAAADDSSKEETS